MNMFNSVRIQKPAKSKFDLDHTRVFSGYMGLMIPCFSKPVLPGERVKLSPSTMVRFAPMLAPIMHLIDVKIDYFYGPNRILWPGANGEEGFEGFITGGRLGTAAPVHPRLSFTEATKAKTAKSTLADYLNVPDLSGVAWDANTVEINAFPFALYQMAYREYYRNQNVEADFDVQLDAGIIGAGAQMDMLTTLRRSMWEKDYFTSALPNTQRGSEVLIPMGGAGNVTYLDASFVKRADTGAAASGDLSADGPGGRLAALIGGSDISSRIENIDAVEFENATITINDLRRAEQVQKFLEKNQIAGGRYKEYLMAHFYSDLNDGRAQRPEYLGGVRQNVVISESLSTATDSAAPGVPPQANMAGHGVSIGRSLGFSHQFPEHGWVIGILRIMPKLTWNGQGIPKALQVFDQLDYPNPLFANLGEQPVMTRELYTKLGADYNDVWGYQSQYAWMKYMQSSTHGEMKDTLQYWHLANILADTPLLNKAALECNPRTNIFAVTDEEQMYVQMYNKCSSVMPLPYYGTPTL